MKKFMWVLSSFALSIVLTGCENFEEKRAERAIGKYYGALMEEDYAKAFTKLYVYDEEPTDDPSTLSPSKAKAVYMEKTALLREQAYRLKDFTIREVEYEDGHSFWYTISIEVELDGENHQYEDIAFFHNGKLKVSGDDPFIEYRDGKMQVPTDPPTPVGIKSNTLGSSPIS